MSHSIFNRRFAVTAVAAVVTTFVSLSAAAWWVDEYKSGIVWPEPPVVDPGPPPAQAASPPSDAIVLFGGQILDRYEAGFWLLPVARRIRHPRDGRRHWPGPRQ